jgi:hypothetical protein
VTLGPFGQALYQQVLPMHGPDPDGLVEDYIGAITLANEEIDGYVRDTNAGPGWSVILDVDDAPAKGLRWLGQLVGVALRQQRNGETTETYAAYARDAIRRQGGRQRGTTDAQMSAIQDTLTGTKSVRFIERAGGDPYAITAITRTAETPDAAATVAAWLRQKPAGLTYTHVISDDPLWVETTKVWSGVAAGEHWDTLVVGDV